MAEIRIMHPITMKRAVAGMRAIGAVPLGGPDRIIDRMIDRIVVRPAFPLCDIFKVI